MASCGSSTKPRHLSSLNQYFGTISLLIYYNIVTDEHSALGKTYSTPICNVRILKQENEGGKEDGDEEDDDGGHHHH